MDNDVDFAPQLYRGTAAYYDRYRRNYPNAMIADLIGRTSPSGQGRLLDLACGTGQLAFPLAPWFADVWAVDSEPDMIDRVRVKAAEGGPDAAKIRAIVGAAEELRTAAGFFELVVIGNAFHRLKRERVARRAYDWLPPGGHLALCWSFMPWNGHQEWQRAFDAVLGRWKSALGASIRIPDRLDQARRELPDAELVFEYGFDMVGHYEFAAEHAWTVPELAGLVRSTSFLPPSVLAEHGADFDADLEAALAPYATGGRLTETVQFAYELARRRLALGTASVLPDRRGVTELWSLPVTMPFMPKISESSDAILRALLERDGDALDARLRNILASQLGSDPDQVTRPQPPPVPDGAATTIHRVKVSLRGAEPPVWRRLELPSDMPLDLVHEVLQTVFGWYDCHYHQFETPCGDYGDPAQNADTWRDDESAIALAQVAGEVQAAVGYVYDFGDDWRHDLVVEAISPATPGVRYPRCTGGTGLPPEEDSGGIRAHNESSARSAVPPGAVDAAELTSALRGLSSVVVPAS